jgi:hypothetical protein
VKLWSIREAALEATVAHDPYATVDFDSDNIGNTSSSSYGDAANLNPNELLERGDRPQSIIYTGNLYVDEDQNGRAHSSFYLSGSNRRLQKDLSRYLSIDPRIDANGWREEWRSLYSRFLFGRMAWFGGRQVLSFWGSGSGVGFKDIDSPTEMVDPAIQKLYSNNYIDDDTIVVLGNGSVGKAGEFLSGNTPKPSGSDDASERNEMAKKLHISTGAVKKNMMRALGVGGGGSAKPNKWDNELRKLPSDKGLAPGHNKWRMSSENHDYSSGDFT